VEKTHQYSPVYPHQPVLGGVRLFQVGKLEIFIADNCVACTVESCWRTVVQLQLSETVIAQFVHEGVQKGGSALGVHPEFAMFGKIVTLLKEISQNYVKY
jgi:hypothetical protein